MVDVISIILVFLFFCVLLLYMLYECYIRENRVINIFGRIRLYDNNESINTEKFNYDEV
jgi:hypothetical protein